MPSIIVNKVFNKKYLKNIIKDSIVPPFSSPDALLSTSRQVSISNAHTVATSGYINENPLPGTGTVLPGTGTVVLKRGTFNTVEINYMTLMTESYLNFLKRLNKAVIEKTINIVFEYDVTTPFNLSSNIKLIGLGLLASAKSYSHNDRVLAINYCVHVNFLTYEEGEKLKNEFIPFITGSVVESLVSANVNFSNDLDVTEIKIPKPMKLFSLFDASVNNINNESLYLCIFNTSVVKLAQGDYTEFSVQYAVDKLARVATPATWDIAINPMAKLDSVTTSESEFQNSFIALKLTTRDGDGDIKIDHVNKIRYLDSLTIKMKLPKQYS